MSITLNNIAVGYGHHNVLYPMCGTFARGSLTAIMGANGGGKSTLLKTIAGVLTPRSGSVICTDELAYLPQRSSIDRMFPISVLDTVLAGCWAHIGVFGSARAYKNQALQVLDTVGLAACAACTIQQLSVGQLQRLLFARLMLQNAPIVLLDEPFAALDEPTTADLIGLVQQWHRQGKTILIVLHDTPQVKQLCPHTLLLSGGAVRAWGKTTDVLTPQHLHALTPAPHHHSYAA
jgi:zinc/manganese transport system ATP-binding protein